MIDKREGNLLEAPTEALVNTVNTVGVMGKGIALQFKKAFPSMFEEYRRACKAGEVRMGHMHVCKQEDLVGPKYIINFPTKTDWRKKSDIHDIDAGLADLARVIHDLDIHSVAIPPLGCGLGGLNWQDVSELITRHLGTLADVEILVYPPKGSPSPEALVNRTPRPKMTPSRASILCLLKDYLVLGYRLTLLEVQKLLYFYQEAGEPLQLRFQQDAYGPYADNLRHVLNKFEGHFTSGVGDGRNKPNTPVDVLPDAVAEAEQFLETSPDEDSRKRAERVLELIEGFESPYGMELLASVHWVTVHGQGPVTDADGAVRVVHAWSERKRQMMQPRHISAAWKRLESRGWLSSSS